MDDIKEQISKISIETKNVQLKDIQDVMKVIEKVRNTFGCTEEYIKCCNKLLDILWQHMKTGFGEFDNQLLCSTYFYTILVYSSEKECYLKKVLDLLCHELNLKENGIEASNTMSNTISLTYGIFQSSILQQNAACSMLVTILGKTYTLMTVMAYEYSQYTFITFKILTLFKKVISTPFEYVIFNKDHNFKLLHLVNQNWENPITGVRNLNKMIFHNLISVADEIMLKFIETKLNGFYWNKAKYLMLAEVIDHFPGDVKELIDKYDMLEGLVYSLRKTGLVSAGADMYMAILKKINTDKEWCAIFFPVVTKILKGSSVKIIENFNNYWCLNTLKKFPSISQIIFDEINQPEKADNIYSCLCIIQQSNRLGLFKKYFVNYNLSDLVLNNIDHHDIYIRMISFNILCGLNNNFLPTPKQYDVILDFLKNNINSDSSILRISMIKSFQNFLVQLHMTFANINGNKDSDVENLTKFCKQLQFFIIESLNYDGNYQRKIATLQIAQSMLTIFKEIPRKKQKGTRQLRTSLLDFLKSSDEWILSQESVILKFIDLLKDSSDDIRDHVLDILIRNYSDCLSKKEMIDYLIENGLSCLKSRFFYQITCGQTIFKLIPNILLIEKCPEGTFKDIDDVFHFSYNEIKSGSNSHIDIVKSIVEGKQLHSYLNILHNIYEVSLEKSHELNVSSHEIHSLIEILKVVSNQFSWEQETSVSSDFSKMNDMVEELIARSEYKVSYQYNETNTSGLHQIVLNCLWLNVKASCELSSILIQYYKNDNHQEVCEKCLKLICNVLETSRHKGAIEAGGIALGKAIQQLTSTPSTFTISKLPMILLKEKLKQLVQEKSNMASVTRRGAGLSIMIHRIVSSDMKKGKPLFHYFMQTLLETCDNLPEDCNYDGEKDIDNEKDLPQAIFIHFLTKIVTDSSLASDMMYYSGKLAKLAFDNLSSSCWQIRNAALQLYGSLIPKIIGQKKNSGASDEVMATVAVDEFRTHSPKLWEYIGKQLELSTQSQSDVVQSHNNLVPILSLLANLAPIYSFSDYMDCEKNILSSLVSLLGSPIYVVRRLASKCILNIYPFDVILDVLLNSNCNTENSLHGTLVLLNYFNLHYNVKERVELGDNLKKRFELFISRRCSYLSREQFERTFPEILNLNEEMLKETLSELQVHGMSSGIFLWANSRIELFLKTASWDQIPQIITLISDCCDFETYCEKLCKRIEDECFMNNKQVLIQISSTLYPLGFKRKSPIVWKTLYEISLHLQSLSEHLDTSLLHQYLLDNGVVYRMRYTIVLAARIFQNNATEELLCLSNIIFKLCLPETDLDLRLLAATANNELANKFECLPDPIKINSIQAAVMFLQDEDDDVRNLSVQFYSNVTKNEMTFHPYICWTNIVSTEFLHKVLNNPQMGIQCICNNLLDLLVSLKSAHEDEYNPFVSDSKNNYLELVVLGKVLSDVKDVTR